jgi:peptidoglycan hydrolase-like protein with peptidoglycan-binding domain
MRKIISLFITLSFIFPVFAFAQTANSPAVQAQLQALEQQLSQLQNQANGTTAQNNQSSGAYVFTRSLTVGSQGADVSALQQILINDGHLTAITAPSGYFGQATKKALIAYQNANGISPATGYCGPITIAFLDNASSPTASAASASATPTTQSQPQMAIAPPNNQQATDQQTMASTTFPCNGTNYTACPAGQDFVCPASGAGAYCQSPQQPTSQATQPDPYEEAAQACATYQAEVASTSQQVRNNISEGGGFGTESQVQAMIQAQLQRQGIYPPPLCSGGGTTYCASLPNGGGYQCYGAGGSSFITPTPDGNWQILNY